MRNVCKFVIPVLMSLPTLAQPAHGLTLRIERPLPIGGIAQAPTGDRYFRPHTAITGGLPAADVHEMLVGAPANGCEASGGGFRVMSGPVAGRGCVGGP